MLFHTQSYLVSIVLYFSVKGPVTQAGMSFSWTWSWASDSSGAGVLSPGEGSLPTSSMLFYASGLFLFVFGFPYSFFPFKLLF